PFRVPEAQDTQSGAGCGIRREERSGRVAISGRRLDRQPARPPIRGSARPVVTHAATPVRPGRADGARGGVPASVMTAHPPLGSITLVASPAIPFFGASIAYSGVSSQRQQVSLTPCSGASILMIDEEESVACGAKLAIAKGASSKEGKRGLRF